MFLLSTFDVFRLSYRKARGKITDLMNLRLFPGQGDDTLHALLASKLAAFRQEPNVAADSHNGALILAEILRSSTSGHTFRRMPTHALLFYDAFCRAVFFEEGTRAGFSYALPLLRSRPRGISKPYSTVLP